MLGSDRFTFETPNVIDPGDLPPSRPRRQAAAVTPPSRRDSNTDSTTDENSTSSDEEYAARESATRLLRDIDDIDHLTTDYDPYENDEEYGIETKHEQLPSAEDARMYAASLLKGNRSGGGSRASNHQRGGETVPLSSFNRTIQLEAPSSKHLVRRRAVRCLVPVLVVAGLMAATISLGLALVNRLSDNNNNNSSLFYGSSRFEASVDYLAKAGISNRLDMETAGTPQNLAVNWVADVDPLAYDLPNSGGTTDNFRFVQRYALVTFFFALRGTEWTEAHNFLTNQDECGWFESTALDFVELETAVGVSCNPDLRVDGIFLPSNNLQGKVPPEVGHLKSLQTLALPYNDLTGEIPEGVADLSNLIYLDFRYNILDGNIPSFVGDFEYLEVLGLSNNEFRGSVPPSMGTLRRLKTLALDDNELTGSLGFASYLSKLEFFYADRNLFEQTLDGDFFSNLERLRQLDLSSNLLSSTEFPLNLASHADLEVLDLANNEFGGSLPVAIASNTVLEFLSLRGNLLTGEVPINLPALYKLSHLDLSENKLAGSIPGRLSTMTTLTFLALGENDFYPDSLPGLLSELTNLRELSMPGVQLSGPVPNWLTLLTDLELLDLSHNDMTGDVPSGVWNLPELAYLLLHDNVLDGIFPVSVGANDLKVVTLHKNNFSGNTGAVCDAATDLNLLATDCGAEIVCSASCCPKCCEEDDVDCFEDNMLHDLTTVEGQWEFNYKRSSYSFDPAILEESGVAVVVP